MFLGVGLQHEHVSVLLTSAACWIWPTAARMLYGSSCNAGVLATALRKQLTHFQDVVGAFQSFFVWASPEQIIERRATGVPDEAGRGHETECVPEFRPVQLEQALPVVRALLQTTKAKESFWLMVDLIEPLAAPEVSIEAVHPRG